MDRSTPYALVGGVLVCWLVVVRLVGRLARCGWVLCCLLACWLVYCLLCFIWLFGRL